MSTIAVSTNWLEETESPVFEGQKLVVVGGSSGIGRQTAADVVAAGGSAVIIGLDPEKVDDTVETLAQDGSAWGITADLADPNRWSKCATSWPRNMPTPACS